MQVACPLGGQKPHPFSQRTRKKDGTPLGSCPTLLIWFCDQSSGCRIAVHLTQLFDALLVAPDVEVIEEGRPEVGWLWLAALISRSEGLPAKRPSSRGFQRPQRG